MTYRLAIYTDPTAREPARVAILSPGARPDEVEGVDELSGVTCDELLVAPSVHAKQMAEAYEAWVGPLPSPEDALYLPDVLLRQQLIVLERQVKRPELTWRDRGLMVLLSSWLKTWREALLIVQPDTVTRWHRDIYRLVWRLKSKTKSCVGRPPISAETVRWIRRLARENQL